MSTTAAHEMTVMRETDVESQAHEILEGFRAEPDKSPTNSAARCFKHE